MITPQVNVKTLHPPNLVFESGDQTMGSCVKPESAPRRTTTQRHLLNDLNTFHVKQNIIDIQEDETTYIDRTSEDFSRFTSHVGTKTLHIKQ